MTGWILSSGSGALAKLGVWWEHLSLGGAQTHKNPARFAWTKFEFNWTPCGNGDLAETSRIHSRSALLSPIKSISNHYRWQNQSVITHQLPFISYHSSAFCLKHRDAKRLAISLALNSKFDTIFETISTRSVHSAALRAATVRLRSTRCSSSAAFVC